MCADEFSVVGKLLLTFVHPKSLSVLTTAFVASTFDVCSTVFARRPDHVVHNVVVVSYGTFFLLKFTSAYLLFGGGRF
jgi:hypothetical protein